MIVRNGINKIILDTDFLDKCLIKSKGLKSSTITSCYEQNYVLKTLTSINAEKLELCVHNVNMR